MDIQIEAFYQLLVVSKRVIYVLYFATSKTKVPARIFSGFLFNSLSRILFPGKVLS